MPLRTYKPVTPSRRGLVTLTFEEITRAKPEKSLVVPAKKHSGRNNQGKVTVRHQGGGVKRMYRLIDFKRDKVGVPGRVASIEYDPNRTVNIALIFYADGEKRYILAPQELKVGDTILSGEQAEIKPGNTLPLRLIPAGTLIHNIELTRGRGGQMARSAGEAAQLMTKEESYALVRLPSGEMRRIRIECWATIGQLGNVEHQNISLGKAGRSRLMGRRPAVRGKAMSPRDHPHGGGEGRNPIGLPGPKSPWGKPTRGYRTRKKSKPSNKFIVRRREK